MLAAIFHFVRDTLCALALITRFTFVRVAIIDIYNDVIAGLAIDSRMINAMLTGSTRLEGSCGTLNKESRFYK